MQGNHCGCMGAKPCEVEHNTNKRDKLHKKRKDRYNRYKS